MSLAAWHFLRHLCEYASHHTQPTGRGCKDEALASLTLYGTSKRGVIALPADKPKESK